MMNAWRSCAELARYRISSHVRLDATALKWMENRRLTDILLRPYSFLLCLAKETGSSTERRKRMGSGDPPGLQIVERTGNQRLTADHSGCSPRKRRRKLYRLVSVPVELPVKLKHSMGRFSPGVLHRVE